MTDYPSPPELTPSVEPVEGAEVAPVVDVMPSELWQRLWREPFTSEAPSEPAPVVAPPGPE